MQRPLKCCYCVILTSYINRCKSAAQYQCRRLQNTTWLIGYFRVVVANIGLYTWRRVKINIGQIPIFLSHAATHMHESQSSESSSSIRKSFFEQPWEEKKKAWAVVAAFFDRKAILKAFILDHPAWENTPPMLYGMVYSIFEKESFFLCKETSKQSPTIYPYMYGGCEGKV